MSCVFLPRQMSWKKCGQSITMSTRVVGLQKQMVIFIALYFVTDSVREVRMAGSKKLALKS